MSFPSVIAADNPVAWYRLNETSGIVAADSGSSGNHGTYNAGVTLGVAGMLADGDKAIQFNGTTGQITAADTAALRLSNNFTIEFIIKVPTLAHTNRYLLTRAGGGQQSSVIYGFVANTIELFQNGGSGNARTNSQIVIPDTGFHHIVYSYDGATLLKSIDGAVTSVSNTFSFSTAAGAGWFIGSATSSNYFAGMMDELMIYNAAHLSSARIAAHYAAISDAGLLLPRRRRSNLLLNSL